MNVHADETFEHDSNVSTLCMLNIIPNVTYAFSGDKHSTYYNFQYSNKLIEAKIARHFLFTALLSLQ